MALPSQLGVTAVAIRIGRRCEAQFNPVGPPATISSQADLHEGGKSCLAFPIPHCLQRCHCGIALMQALSRALP